MKDPTRIPTTLQQRAQEALWIETCHPSWGMVLMELAGYGAFKVARTFLNRESGPVVVVCGSGNNGGDGLVVARYLFLSGIKVLVYLIKGQSITAPSEGSVNLSIAQKLGVEVSLIEQGNVASLRSSLEGASLVVDALLGTGLDRMVQGIHKDVIDVINQSEKPVLAIDIPSGISSDTGQIMGTAVVATATVTFGYLKSGLVCYPGAEYGGEIHLVDIGLPDLDSNILQMTDQSDHKLTTAQFVRSCLPVRHADSHKGSFGRVVTIAGSLGMSGASILAGKSALRAGAGLSVLATVRSVIPNLPSEELIYAPLAETNEGKIKTDAISEIQEQLSTAQAVVLGPGISLSAETIKLVQELIQLVKIPCLVDADGLNAVAHDTTTWPRNASHFVLTPHPKELARLMDTNASNIQSNRIMWAKTAAARFGCTVVLKGAHTVIANEQQRVFVNPTGNAGMATAGAGDVLSGVIGGLLAQGLKPFEAAIAGAYIHGLAGDLASEAIGEVGIVAGDIMTFVPAAISEVKSHEYIGCGLEQRLFNTIENILV